jgi:hypothetical protein
LWSFLKFVISVWSGYCDYSPQCQNTQSLNFLFIIKGLPVLFWIRQYQTSVHLTVCVGPVWNTDMYRHDPLPHPFTSCTL